MTNPVGANHGSLVECFVQFQKDVGTCVKEVTDSVSKVVEEFFESFDVKITSRKLATSEKKILREENKIVVALTQIVALAAMTCSAIVIAKGAAKRDFGSVVIGGVMAFASYNTYQLMNNIRKYYLDKSSSFATAGNILSVAARGSEASLIKRLKVNTCFFDLIVSLAAKSLTEEEARRKKDVPLFVIISRK